MLAPADRLIVALDMPDPASARALVDRLQPDVTFFKIGLELLYAGGAQLARELAAEGRNVFVDAKLLDIPNTVERATAAIARLDARFLTVHGADAATLQAAVRGRGEAAMQLLAVTVLTSLTRADLAQQGISREPADLVVERARLAAAAGFDGVVASAAEAAAIREACGAGLRIVTPGIRPAGAQTHDQARVTTPARAIAAGADYLVVGRPILQAPAPRAAAQAIIAEIESAQAH